MSKMFTYLDKYYTAANQERCPKLLPKSWLIFKSVIFEQFNVAVRKAILSRIKRERENEPQDRQILKEAIAVFAELGFKLHGAELGISLYRQHFEVYLFQETTEFYRSLARQWISQDSFPDYLSKVEAAMAAEESRLKDYLHNSSQDGLKKAAFDELLVNLKNELIGKETGPVSLMAANATADLSRMFLLFSQAQGGLTVIAKIYFEHIKSLGFGIVDKRLAGMEQKEQKEADEDHVFVRQLIDLHERYRTMTSNSFQGHQLFQKALKEAFESFINKDSSISQLLAKYVSDVLKKGSKFDSNEVEQIQLNVVLLYGYIREKDIFELEYQNLLAKRLLEGLSQSEDQEKSMIAKLKNECGYQWTSKLEGMFKDVQNSKEICQEFQKKFDNRFKIDFEVNICTQGNWPSVQTINATIPGELQLLCQSFKDFYLHAHSGRRVTWRMDHGQADVKVKFSADASYQLTVTTFQMVVLLLFNLQEKVTYKEISEMAGIPFELLEVQVKSLAHPKVKVLLKTPATAVFEPEHTFQLNEKYTSKMLKVKIPLMKTQVQARQEESDRDSEIETQRRHQIDAATVRVMKARKTLSHQQLVSEVVNQLSARFQPKLQVIKQRIEHLIEQEYLERDPKDRSVYNYLA